MGDAAGAPADNWISIHNTSRSDFAVSEVSWPRIYPERTRAALLRPGSADASFAHRAPIEAWLALHVAKVHISLG